MNYCWCISVFNNSEFRNYIIFIFILFAFPRMDANGQMPGNSFVYSKSQFVQLDTTSNKKHPPDCPVDTTKAFSFFIRRGAKAYLITSRVEFQMDYWKRQLDTLTSIHPELACYEQQLIGKIEELVSQQYTSQLDSIERNYPLNGAYENNKHLDSLRQWARKLDSVKKQFSALNSIYGSPKMQRRFFPARNTTQTTMIYQRYGTSILQFGNTVTLYGWNNRGTINPEVVSFIAGPFRFGFNTIVSSTGTNSKEDIAQLRTLSANGGNIVASLYYPTFHTLTQGTAIFSQLSLKFASEVPILGSPFSADTIYQNANLGIDLNFAVRLPTKKTDVSLFFYTRPAYIIGSMPYLNTLGVDDNFYLVQSALGIDIGNVGRIGFSLPTISSTQKLKTNSFLLSLQFLL